MAKSLCKLISCATILCCLLKGNSAYAQFSGFGNSGMSSTSFGGSGSSSFGSCAAGFGNSSSGSFDNVMPTIVSPMPSAPRVPSISNSLNNSLQSPAAGYNVYPSDGGLPKRVVPSGGGIYNVYPSAGGLPERIIPSGGGYNVYQSGRLSERVVPSGNGSYNIYPSGGGMPARAVRNGAGQAPAPIPTITP